MTCQPAGYAQTYQFCFLPRCGYSRLQRGVFPACAYIKYILMIAPLQQLFQMLLSCQVLHCPPTPTRMPTRPSGQSRLHHQRLDVSHTHLSMHTSLPRGSAPRIGRVSSYPLSYPQLADPVWPSPRPLSQRLSRSLLLLLLNQQACALGMSLLLAFRDSKR
jgi:hypothetical protein